MHPADLEHETTAPQSRQIALLAHLAAYSNLFLPAIAPLLLPIGILAMRPDDPFVVDHAKESLNFQISLWLYGSLFGLLSLVLIGLPFLLAVISLGFFMPIVASVEALSGNIYRYPLAIRLVR
ncbi:MAG TPA: DUF4870 domain-containing protein [Deltaproteobacteria bacterium]|nr:DUF4870 domain-containing protein [Deltaproteobacteria bacterium]